MSRGSLLGAAAILLLAGGGTIAYWWSESDRAEQFHYDRGETRVVLSNPTGASVRLFRAGNDLRSAKELPGPQDGKGWLVQGNYFIRAEHRRRTLFYPVPIPAYASGPEADGSLVITIRAVPEESRPRLLPDSQEFTYIPGGHFLMGDRLNPREQHYVWVTGFFMALLETTNAEFREFLSDPHGYKEDANWSTEGKRWKSATHPKLPRCCGPEMRNTRASGSRTSRS